MNKETLKKNNIGIIYGGYSSEAIVSERSMENVFSILDKNKFNLYKIELNQDEWFAKVDQQKYQIDKNDFSFNISNKKIKIDFSLIMIHGSPGENGYLQSYFDIIHMPYSSTDAFYTALTFNKFACNQFLKSHHFNVANSILVKQQNENSLEDISYLKFPLFVKPNSGGSSFGITKIKKIDEIETAIKFALTQSDEAIIEEGISGTEVTCGCLKINNLVTALPITQIISDNDYFDYNAKYEGQVKEITPAKISNKLSQKIQKITTQIFNLINATGIIRIDFMISHDEIYILEINTIPGMTKASLIPQQLHAAGLDISDIFSQIIEEKLSMTQK